MSAISIRNLDSRSAPAWDAFVAQCPDATFFHRSGWKDVIEDAFGKSCPFLFAEREGQVVGVLPLVHLKSLLFGHALISTAFCVSGGAAAVDQRAADALDTAAAGMMNQFRADYLEYRQPAFHHEGWSVRDDLYATFEKIIEPEEAANLKQIPRKQRAVVRKALASDLRTTIDDSVDRLYGLYARSVRDLGTPVFSRSYFECLKSAFGDDCQILTVEDARGVAIASVMSFYFRDRVIPYYTGSAPIARRLGANDLMYWRVMRNAIDRGCTLFDFGRSKIGTGPYQFKKNWGFEPKPVAHEYLLRNGQKMPDLNPLNPKFRLFVSAWQKLPLPVANFIGPRIVRNIG